MSKTIVCLALCGLLGMPMLSQGALAQTKQLKKANEGETQRGQVYDGRRDAGTVRAAPAQKPSMVGVSASEFRPKVQMAPTAAPPKPARELNPTGDKAVQKGVDSYRKPK